VIGLLTTVATVMPGLIARYYFTQATRNVRNGVIVLVASKTAKKYAEREVHLLLVLSVLHLARALSILDPNASEV
jgi:hypothetical protein